MNFAEQHYNRDLMPDDYFDATQEQIDEVAKLIYHVGVAGQADFSGNGVGCKVDQRDTNRNSKRIGRPETAGEVQGGDLQLTSSLPFLRFDASLVTGLVERHEEIVNAEHIE